MLVKKSMERTKSRIAGNASTLLSLYLALSLLTLAFQVFIRAHNCFSVYACTISFAKAIVWSGVWPISWYVMEFPFSLLILATILTASFFLPSRTKRLLRAHWREIALATCSVAVTYLLLDVGYRLYQKATLPQALIASVARLSASPTTSSEIRIPDEHTGYRYAPNYEGRRGHPWFSHWRTNSHGHVSNSEYPMQKPSGEYRIAVVGDSFTANITNNVRWTDVLEQQLNDSPKWTAHVGHRFTRVINFGVDGMGIVQFAAMTRHHVMNFEPDLIIVNFIADDILRKLLKYDVTYRGLDRETAIRRYVHEYYLDDLVWWRVYPELFAATVGRPWGMRPGLPLRAEDLLAAGPHQKYSSREVAVKASAQAMRKMKATFNNILFLEMPVFEEMHRLANQWEGLTEHLQRIVPELEILSMRPRMDALLEGKWPEPGSRWFGLTYSQLAALPVSERPELYRWYFWPFDNHMTDYGTSLYGKEVAKLLLERSDRR